MIGRTAVGLSATVLLCWVCQGSQGMNLPPEETAVKNDVDHWGLAFSDQLTAFSHPLSAFPSTRTVHSIRTFGPCQ